MRSDKSGGERPGVWGGGWVAEEEVDEVARWKCISAFDLSMGFLNL